MADLYCPNCDQLVQPKSEAPAISNRGCVMGTLFAAAYLGSWYLAGLSDHRELGSMVLPVAFIGYAIGARSKQQRIQRCPICGTEALQDQDPIDTQR
jgi:hypothetical protein